MKDKPIVIYVTLIAGLIASVICIIRQMTLLDTLHITFITLLVFMIIGLVANKLVFKVNKEVEDRERAERERQEAEEREKERIEREEREKEEQARREQEEREKEEAAAAAVDMSERRANGNRLF